MGIRAIRPVAAAAIFAMLGACAGTPAIGVVADSYCLAAKKISWDIQDTQETINQIVRHNQGYDKACGVKGKSRSQPMS